MKMKKLTTIQYPEFIARAYYILKNHDSFEEFMSTNGKFTIPCNILYSNPLGGCCKLIFYPDTVHHTENSNIIVSLLYENTHYMDQICIETGVLNPVIISQIESEYVGPGAFPMMKEPSELIRLFKDHPLHLFDREDLLYCREVPAYVDDLYFSLGKEEFKVKSFKQMRSPSGFSTLTINGVPHATEGTSDLHGLTIAAFSPSITYFTLEEEGVSAD